MSSGYVYVTTDSYAFVGTVAQKTTTKLSVSASAYSSYVTPAITVPFPSLYGQQTQLAYQYSNAATQTAGMSTIGGVAATNGVSSMYAAATSAGFGKSNGNGGITSSTTGSTGASDDGFHWPTWATGAAAGGGAAVLLILGAAIWLCVRRRKRKQAFASTNEKVHRAGANGSSEKVARSYEDRQALAAHQAGDYPPYPTSAALAPVKEGKKSHFKSAVIPRTKQAAVADPYSNFGGGSVNHARFPSDGTDDAGYATPHNGSAINLVPAGHGASPAGAPLLAQPKQSAERSRSNSPKPVTPTSATGKLPFSERTTPFPYGNPQPSAATAPAGRQPVPAGTGYQPGAPRQQSPVKTRGQGPPRPLAPQQQGAYDRAERIPTSPVLGQEGGWGGQQQGSGGGSGYNQHWAGQQYQQLDRH